MRRTNRLKISRGQQQFGSRGYARIVIIIIAAIMIFLSTTVFSISGVRRFLTYWIIYVIMDRVNFIYLLLKWGMAYFGDSSNNGTANSPPSSTNRERDTIFPT